MDRPAAEFGCVVRIPPGTVKDIELSRNARMGQHAMQEADRPILLAL
jgi:hypothetical protein